MALIVQVDKLASQMRAPPNPGMLIRNGTSKSLKLQSIGNSSSLPQAIMLNPAKIVTCTPVKISNGTKTETSIETIPQTPGPLNRQSHPPICGNIKVSFNPGLQSEQSSSIIPVNVTAISQGAPPAQFSQVQPRPHPTQSTHPGYPPFANRNGFGTINEPTCAHGLRTNRLR